MKVNAFGITNPGGALVPLTLTIRAPGDHEVLIKVSHCGICHTDIIVARGQLGEVLYPLVPGHEIIGRVVEAGSQVTRFKPGDQVGVGCIAGYCGDCGACRQGDEHYCENGMMPSFGAIDNISGEPKSGGYCQYFLVDENSGILIPETLDPAGAAPLLCGGISVYRPIVRHVSHGQKVGVVGLGGLGHLAIKIIKALGASPIMITTTPGKIPDAEHLGADAAILSSDSEAMAAAAGSLDFIINTISADHDLSHYLSLLKRDGGMCLLGAPEDPLGLNPLLLQHGEKFVTGSMIGGIGQTQEMINFCAENGISADVELISMDYINKAWQRLEDNDVKYRFVIDMESLS